MNAIWRYLIPIIWVISMTAGMTAGAEPIRGVGQARGQVLVNSSPASSDTTEGPHISLTRERTETIMRRVRAVIEERKRQGPPPVGCMEG
jgi:hypothetical protein